MKLKTVFFLSVLCVSCNNEEDTHTKSEYIFRKSDETHIVTQIVPSKDVPQYPWESGGTTSFKTITKDYFRCKGSNSNPPYNKKNEKDENQRITDCGGKEKHSLPLKEGKEFVYPILLDLLNHIQKSTKKAVVITSGHRCPDHNTYIDPSKENSTSKHAIGAEVDFYLHGFEKNPEAVIKIIQDFYKTDPRYKEKKEFTEFKRFEKPTNCSIQPWYNKEILIKIFSPSEGRNGDNKHSLPYIAIQVRFDRDTNTPVVYSWPIAQQFLRK